jgi:hypothetical protein
VLVGLPVPCDEGMGTPVCAGIILVPTLHKGNYEYT